MKANNRFHLFLATVWLTVAANGFPLQGIIPPIVTPLIDNDTLDVPATQRLVDHVIDGGVSGVFCLGTTGEFAALSLRLRAEFITACCRSVNGRVPVLVGITDTSLQSTLELAKIAEDSGAAGIVLTTPYYFPLEQSEVIRWVEQVLEGTNLPLVLYNMPQLTKVWYSVETVNFLAKTYHRIVGIKDSSGDLDYFGKICKVRNQTRPDDWTVMIGPEHLLVDAIHLGGDGGVNGGANIYPDLLVSLYDAVKGNDTRKMESLQEKVDALQEIYLVGTPGFRHAVATKCAVSLQGICDNVVAEPFRAFSEEETDQVKSILEQVEQIKIDKE